MYYDFSELASFLGLFVCADPQYSVRVCLLDIIFFGANKRILAPMRVSQKWDHVFLGGKVRKAH